MAKKENPMVWIDDGRIGGVIERRTDVRERAGQGAVTCYATAAPGIQRSVRAPLTLRVAAPERLSANQLRPHYQSDTAASHFDSRPIPSARSASVSCWIHGLVHLALQLRSRLTGGASCRHLELRSWSFS
jgi:hypothetical protein